MRVGLTILVGLLLLTPVGLSLSDREVHHTVLDTFVPAPADHDAKPRMTSVACADQAPSDDDGGPIKGTLGDGSDLAEDCGRLWTDDASDLDGDGDTSGDILAASPPFFSCVADGVDLEFGLQNPFPIHTPEENGDAVDPASQGVLVADGSFFVTPEVGGEDADEVTAIWFGFLETTPNLGPVAGSDDAFCPGGDSPAGGFAASGAYYEFYRGDTNPSDGWTIPVNTLLVPDNIYGAHLRLMGGDPTGPQGGTEVLGTGFVYAIVDNQEEDEGWRPCTPTTASCDYQDRTPPWPAVTPGDVSLDQVANDKRLEIIWGEHIDDEKTQVFIDRDGDGDCLSTPRVSCGELNQAQAWKRPARADVDSVPLFEVQSDHWGPHWTWNLTDPLEDGDKIVVVSQDTHGNSAVKTVTLGSD